MHVALPVVAHGGLGDRGLQGLQVDLGRTGRLGGAGAGLEGGQCLAGVAAGDPHQVQLRLVGEGDGAVQAAVAGQRAVEDGADVVVGERLQGQHERPG